MKKAYKKAKRLEPEMDIAVKRMYDELLRLEKSNCDSIDMIADPFGNMMQDIVKIIMKDKLTEEVSELAYYLGKWIYLIDALDDFDKDKKKKNYNVFICAYKDANTQDELICKYKQDLILVFSSVLSRIGELTSKINYKFNHDLIDNVLYRGLSAQTKRIMEKEKCKNTSKF